MKIARRWRSWRWVEVPELALVGAAGAGGSAAGAGGGAAGAGSPDPIDYIADLEKRRRTLHCRGRPEDSDEGLRSSQRREEDPHRRKSP